MRRRYSKSGALVLLALLGLGASQTIHLTRAEDTQPAYGQVSQALADEYLQARKASANGPGLSMCAEVHGKAPEPLWAIYGFAYDPSDPAYELRATVGTGVAGNETVPDMVQQMPKGAGIPVASVNADFFEINKGDRYLGSLQGLCIVNGEMVATPMSSTFWIDAKGKAQIGNVTGKFQVTWPDATVSGIALNCATSDFKTQVKAGDVVLYTGAFGPTTLGPAGREAVLEPVDPGSLPVRANQVFKAKVVKVETTGNAVIPKNGVVITIGSKAEKSVPALKPGDTVSISLACAPDMTGVNVAVGGSPILLKDGELAGTPANRYRAPRTAVGIHPDGRVEFVVVDGRQPAHSIGMTLLETALWMKSIGCTQVLNLDGGGSSTLWYEGKVMNSPSDGQLRKVGNALILLKKEKP